MVVAFSPLVGEHGRAHVLSLAQHGHIVIVVDTQPPDPPPQLSPWDALAQRVRTMERQADIDHLAELGVPVVPWRGPGTLDDVLRNASRLAGAPRAR